MDQSLFGKRVAALRKWRGWSQEELGDRVGVSRQQVTKWENDIQGTSTERLHQLYEIFGVTPAQFWDPDFPRSGDVSVQQRLDLFTKINTDANGRALSCPECGEDRYGDQARYCPMCGYALYNFCITEERHINTPEAKYCETCGSRTFWGLSREELDSLEVPPDYHTFRNNEAPAGKR